MRKGVARDAGWVARREPAPTTRALRQAPPGHGAEALRAYERCRRLIAEELGIDPSRETKAVYESVLASL